MVVGICWNRLRCCFIHPATVLIFVQKMSELETPNKNNNDDAAERQPLSIEFFKKNRHDITFSERKFDVNTLPDDMRRVYGHLEEKFGEEYGLIFIFSMRTAVELHRAWNMVSCCEINNCNFMHI